MRRHTGLPAEFLLQGLRDLQVTMSDAQLLKKADPAATLVMLSNVNHVLKSVASDDRRANVATYSDPSLPLAPGVLEALVTIAFESPDQPEAIALVAELDAYHDALYPPESRHYLDLAALKQANV
jgi:hypothetical protein